MATKIDKMIKCLLYTIVIWLLLFILGMFSFLLQLAIEQQETVPWINHVYYTINNFDENAFICKIDTLKRNNIISTVEIENRISETSSRKRQYTIYSLDEQYIVIHDSIKYVCPTAVSFQITNEFGLLTGESLNKLKFYNDLLDGTCECDRHIILNIIRGGSIIVFVISTPITIVLILILLMLWLFKSMKQYQENKRR